jgi:multidrug transporter EmrE-like cation transporter
VSDILPMACSRTSASAGETSVSYLFVIFTVLLTAYGQVVLKWQVGLNPALSISRGKPIDVIVAIFVNPWVLSAFAAAFAASLCWIAALSKLPLSKAYPITALSFPLIGLLSFLVFGEAITWAKAAGTLLICLGIVVLAQS